MEDPIPPPLSETLAPASAQIQEPILPALSETPSPDSSKAPSSVPSKPPILLLLDINGTVVFRAKQKKIPNCDTEPLFQFKFYFVYRRPKALLLFERLLAHPRARVAIMTSMIGSNTTVVLENSELGIKLADLAAIFDQSFHKPDLEQGEKEWDTMRDMEKVWSSQACIDMNCGPESTICIDNETRKIREHLGNAIIIPSYGEQGIRAVGTKYEDTILEQLSDYLTELLDKCEGDVRAYIAAHPFIPTVVEREDGNEEEIPIHWQENSASTADEVQAAASSSDSTRKREREGEEVEFSITEVSNSRQKRGDEEENE